MGNRKLMIVSSITVVLLVIISIAFAALSQTLNISFGNVTQNALTWNVGFKGSSATATQEGTSSTGLSCGTASITPSTVTISESTLSKPGDKCIYNLAVENKGDISAKLESISATQPTSTSCTITNGSTMVCGNIKYQLSNVSNEALTAGIIINAYEQYNMVLTVAYIGESLSSTEIVQNNAKFTLTYSQSEGRSSSDLNGISSLKVNEYSYSGKEEVLEVPFTGKYKLEVWGAQGGGNDEYPGGYGGYSTGIVELTAGDNLYINVGGAGVFSEESATNEGGYNGGGNGYDREVMRYHGSGGGATHIATSHGLLKELSENRTSVLIVAGGGGGTGGWEIYWYDGRKGGHAGGFEGSKGEGHLDSGDAGEGGTQTTSHPLAGFGYGASGGTVEEDFDENGWLQPEDYHFGIGGGGGGWFGGGIFDSAGGAGGSGYIGNSRLKDAVMYCYECTPSDEDSTKTVSTTDVSDTPASNYSKIGNGYARITYIG